MGQVLSVDTPDVSYQYIYDSAQRLATVTDSRGGKILTYRHSSGGLLDSLEDNEGGRQDYLYDAVGASTSSGCAGYCLTGLNSECVF